MTMQEQRQRDFVIFGLLSRPLFVESRFALPKVAQGKAAAKEVD